MLEVGRHVVSGNHRFPERQVNPGVVYDRLPLSLFLVQQPDYCITDVTRPVESSSSKPRFLGRQGLPPHLLTDCGIYLGRRVGLTRCVLQTSIYEDIVSGKPKFVVFGGTWTKPFSSVKIPSFYEFVDYFKFLKFVGVEFQVFVLPRPLDGKRDTDTESTLRTVSLNISGLITSLGVRSSKSISYRLPVQRE